MTDPCTQDSIDSRECNSEIESENDTENVLVKQLLRFQMKLTLIILLLKL
jgi:hypothetical protein